MKTNKVAVSALVASGIVMASVLSACTIGDVSDKQQSSDTSATAEQNSGDEGPQPTRGGAASDEKATTENGAGKGSLTEADLKAMVQPGTAIAVAGLGHTDEVAVPAWSTMKVPVAIAALRAGSADMSALTSAITASDNASAEALWSSLGSPEEAAQKTGEVLKDAGVNVAVNAQVTRPGFSAFGQTMWNSQQQADFASQLRCVDAAEPVATAMGSIVSGQNYGLGQFSGAIYKGGWGPNESGSYGVRQFGLIPRGDGSFAAVAIAAQSTDGSYESGQAQLNELASKLKERAADLPAAQCG